MGPLEDFKYWLRSGSWKYARSRRHSGPERSLLWNSHEIHYRPGTSDTELIDRILLKPRRKLEYQFPVHLRPSVILDIGANIGMTTVRLAHQYPEAHIYSFEPEPENFRLLRQNTEGLRVTAFPFGLGSRSARLPLFHSDDGKNRGGFSFYSQGVDLHRSAVAEIREINGALGEIGLSRVDLIKVDTEGAEHEILTSLDPKLLRSAAWIGGELHGEKDFELLAHLSQWFDVAVKKEPGSRLGHFQATIK